MYRFMDQRPQEDFQKKIQGSMELNALNALLLTSPESIFYATGYLSGMYGRGEAIGTDLAVVLPKGRVKLIVSQFTQAGAELQTMGKVEIIGYPTYMFIEDYYDPKETEKPAETGGERKSHSGIRRHEAA